MKTSIDDRQDDIQYHDYNKANFSRITECLSIDWEREFSELNGINAMWELFVDKYHSAVDQHVPLRSPRRRKTFRIPLDKSLRSKIKTKSKLRKAYLRSGSQEILMRYRRINNQVRRLTRKAEKKYEEGIANQIKENPKKFWRFVKAKTRMRAPLPDLLKEDGSTLTTSDTAKANVLASFFSSVFTNEQDMNLEPPHYCQASIGELLIVQQEVMHELGKLDTSKSTGPDDIHPRVLREAKEAIAVPLTHIFQESLNSGSLPRDWKIAYISAIHKKGPKNLAENYRPVSLTSIVVKTLERIIRAAITAHMRTHSLFSPKQFGFIGGRSTVLQLLSVLDEWTKALDNGSCVDVIYCDFRKAFDKVPHRQLLAKVKAYGIDGPLLAWISDFLCDRQQRVRVSGSYSEWHPVKSGIPQGSVLGPLLFVLYVNDLPDVITSSSIYLFADDLKIFREVSSSQDCDHLQQDLEKVCEWTENAQLKLHEDKCVTMTIGQSDQTRRTPYRLTTNNHTLKEVPQEKDLGVVIDNKLNFSEHLANKVNKANSILGLIWRTFEYKNQETMLTLYKTLVRPHLEYANQIWSPHLIKDITSVENVQRRATRMIPHMKDLSYEERLIKLRLPTLSYRRLRGDMIEMYKICTGISDVDVTRGLLDFNHDDRTRGHPFKLQKKRCNLNIRKFSFFNRVVNPWNSLPVRVIEAPTLISFEGRLDKHWERHPIKYDFLAPPH